MRINLFVWIIVGINLIVRILETILPGKTKQKGKITAKWMLTCFAVSGISVYVLGISEFVLRVKNAKIMFVVIGTVLVLIRIFLKHWATKTLGRYWSMQIEIRDDQKLITDGPYRYIRHPAYLSTLLEAVGVTIMLNAYYTLTIFCIMYLPIMIIRINLEEKELYKKFGKEFMDYRAKVPAILPVKFL
ncbi:MAG: hypothetical protein A2452_08715 [Candidatus Firestonebacteria bacterium RIFOXYC2_FULL_39_67]|nr:MAG: hypothetical protein A2536_09855 [Candidatus Firestonebacteria bacterium RIFOXYD2_FULL_39_29]OGF57041.1 MAG: hypothetical protein A2497_09255 [Candidatus Firestonebacteria bacterium RifOxyC12_full_39_7]OGF57194.1 MAG: hypothetical protein A2452_08715 [Candidatus Firestonebacteria bacterium RIFOXYC2_FULL_39_67]